MKLLFTLSFVLFGAICSNAQTVLEKSKTEEIKKDGINITTFENKPFTGFLIENYANGKPKSWISMKDGIVNGLWQEWYENGQLKFNAYWLNGKGHGLWEYYHQNGVLRQEEFYNLDIATGIFRDFFNNGQLKSKSSWLNGKKHGVWTFYNEWGILLKTEVYAENKQISKTDN